MPKVLSDIIYQCQREDFEFSWVSPALWEFLGSCTSYTWSNISGHCLLIKNIGSADWSSSWRTSIGIAMISLNTLGCYHNSEVLASRNEEGEKLHSKQSFTQSRGHNIAEVFRSKLREWVHRVVYDTKSQRLSSWLIVYMTIEPRLQLDCLTPPQDRQIWTVSCQSWYPWQLSRHSSILQKVYTVEQSYMDHFILMLLKTVRS